MNGVSSMCNNCKFMSNLVLAIAQLTFTILPLKLFGSKSQTPYYFFYKYFSMNVLNIRLFEGNKTLRLLSFFKSNENCPDQCSDCHSPHTTPPTPPPKDCGLDSQ